DQVLRMTSQTFYGMNIHWTRYCGMYSNLEAINLPSKDDPSAKKNAVWKRWVARESQLRTLLGLFLVSGVVYQFCGHSISICPFIISLPRPCDSLSFAADTPDKWIEAMMKGNRMGSKMSDLADLLFREADDPNEFEQHRPSFLDIKVLIEIIRSLATEVESAEVLLPTSGHSHGSIIRALARLRQHITGTEELTSMERQVCLLRWHTVSLNMVANSARGARRMCYEHGIPQQIFGGESRKEKDIDPGRWLQSQASRKSLLHALQIQELASQMPLGVSYDEYLPGALFASATTYASFTLPGKPKVMVPSCPNWNVLLLSDSNELGQESSSVESLSENSSIRNTKDFLEGRTGVLTTDCEVRNLAYELGLIRHLLRALSLQWGVAHEMADVVGAWIKKFEENSRAA
ncbi:hypothetical protein AbraIFM66951_002571, partial [Aspergillus brasiliensis]